MLVILEQTWELGLFEIPLLTHRYVTGWSGDNSDEADHNVENAESQNSTDHLSWGSMELV